MRHVFRLALIGATCLIWFASQTLAQESLWRIWTTSNGRKSDVRLKFVSGDSKAVKLQREDNGKFISIAKAQLSAADLKFVASLTKPSTSLSPSLSPRPSSGSATAPASAGWPQWRGVNRDGKNASTGLLQQWPQEGPTLAWNISGLGEGYSTPAVSDNVVYVLGAIGSDEFVFALNADDGSEVWKTRFGSKSSGGGYPGPRGTPTIDGDRLYAIGSDGTLACLSRSNGQLAWSKNLKSDFNGDHGHWDYAESPLIDGELLICTPGGVRNTIVALRKSNGSQVWGSAIGQMMDAGFAKAGYASIIKTNLNGLEQYVGFLNGGVVGISARDGSPLWHYDRPANDTANCSTPIANNNQVFAASAYGTGGGLAMINRSGNRWSVKEKYFSNKFQNHHGGFVLHDGYLYGTNDSVLMCIDWNSGELQWQDRCVGKGSVSLADGHLYVRGEKGDIALVEATPEDYREKGRFSQPDRSGKNAWPHPVIAGNRLYIHDDDRMLCFELQ